MHEMMLGRFYDPYGADIHHPPLNLGVLTPARPRDPDAFYWKDGRPSVATNFIELTCENWRHSAGDEQFLFRVTSSNTDNVSGAIQCEIHAQNLSDPVKMTLPVRIERIAKSTFDHAQTLINRLSAR